MGPPVDNVQLVNITTISLGFIVVITIVRWGYKPTYNVWGPHIVCVGNYECDRADAINLTTRNGDGFHRNHENGDDLGMFFLKLGESYIHKHMPCSIR